MGAGKEGGEGGVKETYGVRRVLGPGEDDVPFVDVGFGEQGGGDTFGGVFGDFGQFLHRCTTLSGYWW